MGLLGSLLTKRVLVVDDDPFIVKAVEKFLQLKGFKVITATDPAVAYQLAQEEKPHLIISDIDMPGVDGFTLLSNLRVSKVTRKTPLVLLTSTDKFASIEKGFSTGAQAYILKPLEWNRFWEKIKPFLE